MKKNIVAAAVVFLTSIGLTAGAQAGWVSAEGGYVPPGALVSGHEANGERLYACRAHYNGGLHPGKIRREFGGCNIGWGGKEIAVRQYEVYEIWERAANGQVPVSAVVAGEESDGSALYICRGNYNGGLHSGKVRREFGACNISWGGQEVKVNPYEVLVR